MRLGQAAQKQQRPHCSNQKMYLEISGADEGAYTNFADKIFQSNGARIEAVQFESRFKLRGTATNLSRC